MKSLCRTLIAVVLTTMFIGCTTKEAPRDSQGKTPQQVLLETYTLILEGKDSEAESNFSPEFIEELITKNESTFIEYCSNTKGWKADWLKTKIMGNDYNDNVWRVKIIPDEGKGSHNGPGIVQDFSIVNGVWKVVFWGHYKKS